MTVVKSHFWFEGANEKTNYIFFPIEDSDGAGPPLSLFVDAFH